MSARVCVKLVVYDLDRVRFCVHEVGRTQSRPCPSVCMCEIMAAYGLGRVRLCVREDGGVWSPSVSVREVDGTWSRT